MNVLITGITGNFGYALYRHLQLNRRFQLYSGARHPERVNFLLENPDVRVRRFDFYEPETYEPCLREMDTVVLVRPPALSRVKKYIFPFIDQCRRSGVGQILFLSLMGADRKHSTPHYRIEEYIKKSGVSYTFLRPSFFMENLITSHREEIQRFSSLILPAGEGRTNYIAVDDIAKAGAECVGNAVHFNRAYELTGGESFTFTEIAAMLSEELGRKITYTRPGLLQFFQHRRKAGDPAGRIWIMMLIYREVKRGKASRHSGSLKEIFGIEETHIRDFIHQKRDYFL